METTIQPISNPTFQGPGQAAENSPPPSKPFNQVLKEKADAAHDPEKDKDKEKDPSAKPTQLGLLDFWVRFFGREPIPLEQAVLGTSSDLALQAEASLNLVPPLEGQGESKAAGSMGAKALFPFLTEEMAQAEKPMPDASKTLQGSGPEVSAEVSGQPGKGVVGINGSPTELSTSALLVGTEALSASITEEIAQVSEPMPEALRTLQGSVSKEGSTHSSPNNLFAARGDSETRTLNPMLAPTGRQDNPQFFDKSTFQGPYPVADIFSNSSPVEPKLTHLEGPREVTKNPGMISQTDPSLPQEALAATSLPDDGTPPAPSAEATPRPRPISSVEAFQLVQRVGERIAWSAKNNQEVIRLSLEPPELGRLVIEIQKDRDQIKAALFADNSMTQEILETHQFRLQKSLEENGFKLAQYDVFIQKDMGSFQQFEGNSVFRDGQERQPFPTPRPEPDSAHPKETHERRTSGRAGSQVIDRWM